MKVECRYCSKILTDKEMFVDTDQNGKFYFFCDQDHRDKFEDNIVKHKLDMALMMNPFFGIVLMGAWIKSKFKKKNK